MSKFLKFIVHFVVICTILCVVALAVPPFFGVNTVIMDDSEQASNLPMGSVTYAIPVKTQEVAVGEAILVQKGAKTYRYNVVSINQEEGTGVVEDRISKDGDSIPVAIKNYVPKIVITIGFLGYLLVATESIEGLIVLGLAVLFLIILYVIAELWKKEPQDEYDEQEDTEAGYVKTGKELKREEKEKAKLLKEEERQIRDEDKMSRKERKRKKKEEKRIIKTGGFVDEIYEEDFGTEDEERPVTVQTATSEAHELLKKEIAAATAEEMPIETTAPVNAPEAAPEARQEAAPEPERLEEEIPQPIEIKKRAIPAWSAAQLADKAKRDGDAPDIVRDEITKVTLFDYSDIIAEEMEAEE